MASKRVDLHVLHMPGETTRLGSTEHELVNTHHLAGKPNIFEARCYGFSQGTCEYVSFADPDDEIDMSYFGLYVKELDKYPHLAGVYSNSTIIDEEREKPRRFFKDHKWTIDYHRRSHTPVHQCVVMRRDKLEHAIEQMVGDDRWRYKDFVFIEQAIYNYMALCGGFKFLNVNGYTWYRGLTGNHTKMTPDAYNHFKWHKGTLLKDWQFDKQHNNWRPRD